MFFKKKGKKDKQQEQQYPILDISIEQMRQAVQNSAANLPMDISLRTLVNSDHSIDTNMVKSFLNGIPKQTFYMSKETFEIYEDQATAIAVDDVQRATDQYYQETGDYPVIPGTTKVSYFLIKNYLKQEPTMELFLDPKDHMVTHRRPHSK